MTFNERNYQYQVGGSLPMDASTYVVREADSQLYTALKRGEFSYILNRRQVGKSSLMVRTMRQLRQEGYDCIALDMTLNNSENLNVDQWYYGLAIELWRNFGLFQKMNLKNLVARKSSSFYCGAVSSIY